MQAQRTILSTTLVRCSFHHLVTREQCAVSGLQSVHRHRSVQKTLKCASLVQQTVPIPFVEREQWGQIWPARWIQSTISHLTSSGIIHKFCNKALLLAYRHPAVWVLLGQMKANGSDQQLQQQSRWTCQPSVQEAGSPGGAGVTRCKGRPQGKMLRWALTPNFPCGYLSQYCAMV